MPGLRAGSAPAQAIRPPPGLEDTPGAGSGSRQPVFAIEGGTTWAATDKGSMGSLSQVTAAAMSSAGIGASTAGIDSLSALSAFGQLTAGGDGGLNGGRGGTSEDIIERIEEPPQPEARLIPGKETLDQCIEDFSELVDGGWHPEGTESVQDRLVGALTAALISRPTWTVSSPGKVTS